MRRFYFRAVVVVLAVLPFALVVGHPLAVSVWGDLSWTKSDPQFDSTGVVRVGRVAGQEVVQFEQSI